jgi:hypothetical protein
MARVPETGFYFEPISERLALVVEGSPFPSDDHWAFIGDPVDMTPELARIEVATRWPGIDPEELEIELDTVNLLLSQAEALKAAAAALQVPGAKEVEEAVESAAAETVGDSIARAHAAEEEEPSNTSEET